MTDGRDQVVAHLDALELGPPQRVGLLSRERSGSKSVISFAYDARWLARRDSFALDPSLPLYAAGVAARAGIRHQPVSRPIGARPGPGRRTQAPGPGIVRETAPLYRLSESAADGIIAEVSKAVGGWQSRARAAGIAADEVDRLAAAFETVGSQAAPEA